MSIKNIAIVGASGNFGTPITAALSPIYNVTIITRPNSTTIHPPSTKVLRPEYTIAALTNAFRGQDAVVCVVGPAGVHLQTTFIQAAYDAGVKRFVLDDFGWGPEPRSFEEFEAIHAMRKEGWDFAKKLAEEVGKERGFSWTGVTSGNPIDWALRKFPLMGFNPTTNHAIIYDSGNEYFTGTTLEGIGQAVLGIMRHPAETANRFVKVRSIYTNQKELLAAFEAVSGKEWSVERASTAALKESGREKHRSGTSGWVLELVVAQLFDLSEGRGVVARTREESDSELLGVREETAEEVVRKVYQTI